MEEPGEHYTVVFALIVTEPEPVFLTFRGAQESIPGRLKH
jgi:hypothetical protein